MSRHHRTSRAPCHTRTCHLRSPGGRLVALGDARLTDGVSRTAESLVGVCMHGNTQQHQPAQGDVEANGDGGRAGCQPEGASLVSLSLRTARRVPVRLVEASTLTLSTLSAPSSSQPLHSFLASTTSTPLGFGPTPYRTRARHAGSALASSPLSTHLRLPLTLTAALTHRNCPRRRWSWAPRLRR